MSFFSDAQGQLTPKSAVGFCRNIKLIQAFIVVLVTCKNEEDQMSMEIFSDAQGQLTPQSVVESSRNSNSSEIL